MEAADLKVAQDLFGSDTSLDKMQPKTLREYETFGRTVALQYLKPHEQASHYKGLLKALLKSALENLPLQVDCRSLMFWHSLPFLYLRCIL